jgi:cystathionine beta-lyase/cystathionine gamma-synthase
LAKRRGKWGTQTRLIHDLEGKDGPLAVSPPIYQTSTFRLTSPEEGAELAAEVAPTTYYTRYGRIPNRWRFSWRNWRGRRQRSR